MSSPQPSIFPLIIRPTFRVWETCPAINKVIHHFPFGCHLAFLMGIFDNRTLGEKGWWWRRYEF